MAFHLVKDGMKTAGTLVKSYPLLLHFEGRFKWYITQQFYWYAGLGHSSLFGNECSGIQFSGLSWQDQ